MLELLFENSSKKNSHKEQSLPKNQMIKNDFLQYNALTYEGLLFFFQLRGFLYRFSSTNKTNKKRISRPFTISSNLSKPAHIWDNPPHIVSANTTWEVPSSLQKFGEHLLLVFAVFARDHRPFGLTFWV